MFGDARVPQRFWDQIITEPNSGCWLWLGSCFGEGNASYLDRPRHQTLAHRFIYQALVSNGPVSNYLYRVCKQPSCCNPDHIRPKPKKTKERETQRGRRRYHADIEASRAKARRLHPKKQRAKRAKEVYAKYGLTIADVERMRLDQNGRCAICRNEFVNAHGTRMCIDHCHSTGTVRGLLCTSCNLGIGNFRDTTAYLEGAISYLNRKVR